MMPEAVAVTIAFFGGVLIGLFSAWLNSRDPDVLPPSAAERKTPYRDAGGDGESTAAPVPGKPEKPPLVVDWCARTTKNEEDGILSYSCPRCGSTWHDAAPTFCECEAVAGGHFHLTCSGTVSMSGKKVSGGCASKWIMRERTVTATAPEPPKTEDVKT